MRNHAAQLAIIKQLSRQELHSTAGNCQADEQTLITASTVNPFTDVKESDFYYKAVLWAVEQKITNGLTADTFGPFALCNRAQVVTFLWRAMGSPDSTAAVSFTDVQPGQFYSTAVAWAVENGITNGISATEFGVGGICSLPIISAK